MEAFHSSYLPIFYSERRLLMHLEKSLTEGNPVSFSAALPFVNHDFQRLESLLRAGHIFFRRQTIVLHTILPPFSSSSWGNDFQHLLEDAEGALLKWKRDPSLSHTQKLYASGEKVLIWIEKALLIPHNLSEEVRDAAGELRHKISLPLFSYLKHTGLLKPWLPTYLEAIEDACQWAGEVAAKTQSSDELGAQIQKLQEIRLKDDFNVQSIQFLQVQTALCYAGRKDKQGRVPSRFIFSKTGQKIGRKFTLPMLDLPRKTTFFVRQEGELVFFYEEDLNEWWMEFLDQKHDLMQFIRSHSVLSKKNKEKQEALFYHWASRHMAQLKKGKGMVQIDGKHFIKLIPL